MPHIRRFSMLLVLALALACDDTNGLADPTSQNAVDTITIGALEGTSIQTPSGYAVDAGPVRTDLTTGFEFVYNVDASGRRLFVPRHLLGIPSSSGAEPGLQATSVAFDAIEVAPSNGYTTDSAVVVEVGQRWFVRSRVVCTIGVPKYAKLEILSFADSTVTFQVLADNNCGYKGLEPGLPDR